MSPGLCDNIVRNVVFVSVCFTRTICSEKVIFLSSSSVCTRHVVLEIEQQRAFLIWGLDSVAFPAEKCEHLSFVITQ